MTSFFNPRQINGGVIYKLSRRFSNDAAISNLVSPTLPVCSGTSPVVVGVKNAGMNVINTVRVNWSIDNVLQPSTTLTNALDTFGGTGINERNVTLGNMNVTGPSVLRIWTSDVNNSIDSNSSNDTLIIAMNPAMGGNYTINSAAPASATNFQTITAFTDALNTRGICAPVVATIAAGSGPYTGKVTFENVTGASATNTIRLLGNGNTVNVATTTTAGSKEMLLLTGARYVTVDSINFVSTSTAGGWGALVMNNSQYDSITRCKFDLSTVTATASASNSGILVQGSNSTATGGGVGGNNIYIGRNHVLGANGTGGCYYGIAVATGGNHNNIIENNRVENYFYYGIWASAVENLKIINNEIVRPNKSASIGIHNAIYVTGACPDMLIDANRIHSNGVLTATGWSSFYGIRSLADGTATRPVIISNNALYNFKGTSLWLFYINGALYNKIINNTIEFNVNTGSSVANYAYYFTGTNTGTEFINNIASFTTGGTGNKFGFYYSAATAAPDVSEMNNFSMRSTNAGTQYYGYLAANYATRATFRAAHPTREINSPDVDPLYFNAAAGNLTPTNVALLGAGLPVNNYITRDINGVLRPALPTIGAFEREPTNFNDLATFAFTQPSEPFCAGTQDVYVVVQNAGLNTIQNFRIGWEVDNVTRTPVNITRTLVPVNVSGVNLDTFLLGTVNINTATRIKAWSYNPNGGVDTFNINDTISKLFTPAVFELTAAQDTVCAGGDVMLTVSNAANTMINNGDIEWYTSTNGTSWTLVPNQSAETYNHSNLNTPTYFKARYVANGNNCETNIKQVLATVVAINSVKNDTICANEPAILIANGNNGNILKWYADSLATNLLHTGDTLELNGLNSTTKYWVQSSIAGGGASSVGPLNPAAVSASGGVTGSSYEMYFTVHAATVLKSVDVFATATSTSGSVSILDANNQAIGAYPYTLPAVTGNTVPVTVTINQALAPGDYKMRMTSTSPTLYRNTTGATYPYTSPVLSITGNSFDPVYFYYFYNWQYESGCASPMIPVTAYVSSTPSVDLGSDIDECMDEGTLINLDAGIQNGMYEWDNNHNGRVRVVDRSGTYMVRVYNQLGCEDRDTIVVNIKPNPKSALGSDTSICIDQPIILDAGNDGIRYYWNTGQGTPNIIAEDSGTYMVYITGNNGCVKTDSIHITYNGYSPSSDGIQIRNVGPRKFQFNTINPQYVIGYEWDFGDGSPLSFLQSPTHEYANNGNYLVKCYVTSSCGIAYDTMMVHIYSTSVSEVNHQNRLSIYPNPSTDQVTISAIDDHIQIQRVTMTNILGQIVHQEAVDNLSTMILPVQRLAAGTYQLIVETNHGQLMDKIIKY